MWAIHKIMPSHEAGVKKTTQIQSTNWHAAEIRDDHVTTHHSQKVHKVGLMWPKLEFLLFSVIFWIYLLFFKYKLYHAHGNTEKNHPGWKASTVSMVCGVALIVTQPQLVMCSSLNEICAQDCQSHLRHYYCFVVACDIFCWI